MTYKQTVRKDANVCMHQCKQARDQLIQVITLEQKQTWQTLQGDRIQVIGSADPGARITCQVFRK